MSKSLQAVKGMHDLLPEDVGRWQFLEQELRQLMSLYGYQEIRTPLVESTGLFSRAIGEVTDIVEKEMYTFEDRNGDSLSLRPEGTASCVRAGIEHGLFHNQQQRLWYMGPMFRHERPQKGRYRQFHQVGVEAFGFAGPDIDIELILMTARLWQRLGVSGLKLELNSLGTPESRASYRTMLVDYLESKRDLLDEDSLRRLEHNPLRILDSKNPDMNEVIQNAPLLSDHLDPESKLHFDEITRQLSDRGVEYEINPRLVRGLDYYSRTVFEWVTDELGAQSAICAGGRYDALVEMLGGKETAAVGFAIGLERIIELMKIQNSLYDEIRPEAYIVFVGAEAETVGVGLAEDLRNQGLRVMTHCGGGSLKSQMKKADKSGAKFTLLLGDEEIANGTVTVKDMSGESSQVSLPITDVAEMIINQILHT
ncbi:MAG: histidine--tRNA ligase [Acidiferrobacterales bacterium]